MISHSDTADTSRYLLEAQRLLLEVQRKSRPLFAAALSDASPIGQEPPLSEAYRIEAPAAVSLSEKDGRYYQPRSERQEHLTTAETMVSSASNQEWLASPASAVALSDADKMDEALRLLREAIVLLQSMVPSP